MLEPISIKATTLSDAWFQTLYRCVEKGKQFTIDRGSNAGQKRCEFDFIQVHITQPDKGDLIPQLPEGSSIPNPVEDGYLDDYMPYLMTGEEKEGESYTYGQRIIRAFMGVDEFVKLIISTGITTPDMLPLKNLEIVKPVMRSGVHIGYVVNQMELMIWMYKFRGYRNNQMIMQIGSPTDMILNDPPCLRHIDTRIQDGKLHFFPYFRSWDLYGGFPANLAAIEMMKQYCAEQIGVENGEIIATSKGLHLYDYVFEIAEAIRGKSMDEYRIGL